MTPSNIERILNYHAQVKCQSLFYLPQLSLLLNSHAQVKCQSLFYLPQLSVFLNSHAQVKCQSLSDRRNVTEILLKVVLNTIKQTNKQINI
jgi:hypothetical protein